MQYTLVTRYFIHCTGTSFVLERKYSGTMIIISKTPHTHHDLTYTDMLGEKMLINVHQEPTCKMKTQ